MTLSTFRPVLPARQYLPFDSFFAEAHCFPAIFSLAVKQTVEWDSHANSPDPLLSVCCLFLVQTLWHRFVFIWSFDSTRSSLFTWFWKKIFLHSPFSFGAHLSVCVVFMLYLGCVLHLLKMDSVCLLLSFVCLHICFSESPMASSMRTDCAFQRLFRPLLFPAWHLAVLSTLDWRAFPVLWSSSFFVWPIYFWNHSVNLSTRVLGLVFHFFPFDFSKQFLFKLVPILRSLSGFLMLNFDHFLSDLNRNLLSNWLSFENSAFSLSILRSLSVAYIHSVRHTHTRKWWPVWVLEYAFWVLALPAVCIFGRSRLTGRRSFERKILAGF